jgi:hypothetical protein
VGNIDNCHLSEAILEKQELLIWISLSLLRIRLLRLLLPLCLCSDAILIVTPSDHITSNGQLPFSIMAEAIEKAAAALLLLWDYS